MYTTTAGNPDTKMGAYALGLFEDACPFSENFYDFKNREEALEAIKRGCAKPEHPMLYLEFSYRQLGRTDAWFRTAAARSGATQDAINRDLLNIWQGSTENSVLPQDLIMKIRESKRPPSHTDLSDGFIVSWYVDEGIMNMVDFKQKPLVMGMDTSENVGRDFTTFTIIDPSDMKVVATCRCNEINLMQVGKHVVTLLLRYPNMVFIPERNNTGIAILDFVIEELQRHKVNPFFRIYNEVIQNWGDPKYHSIDIYNYNEIYGRVRSMFGFRTSGSATSTVGSRNILYKSTMMKALEMNHSKIYDSHLINEFCSLQVRNGRIDHPDGGHDDMCFVGSTLIRTDSGNRPISELKVGDLVLTREGYKPVLHVYKREAEVIEKFGFVGTPNHPFITPNGIIPFSELTTDSKVYVWNEKLSSIMERSITDIPNLQENSCADIIIDTISGKLLQLPYIDRFGKTTTARYQQGIASTTEMATLKTIPSKISNASQLQNTEEDIRHQTRLVQDSLSLQENETLSVSGDDLIRSKSMKSLSAVEKQAPRKEVVYNLLVADCHEYFANDVLVHNCISFLLACYLIYYGRNLHMYGIPLEVVLSSVSTNGKVIDPVERQEQIAIKRRIAELEDLVNANPSHMLKTSYLREIASLKQLVDDKVAEVEPIAVSQMKTQERELRPHNTVTRLNSIVSTLSRYTWK